MALRKKEERKSQAFIVREREGCYLPLPEAAYEKERERNSLPCKSG